MSKDRVSIRNISEAKAAIVPIKEFEHETEDQVIVFHAKKLSPIALFPIQDTIAMRSKAIDDELDKSSRDEDYKSAKRAVAVFEMYTKVASVAIVDPDTYKPIFSEEECADFVPAEIITEVYYYATGQSRPISEQEDGEVATFPDDDEEDGEEEASDGGGEVDKSGE